MEFLRVAVGVIKNSSGQILISLRDKNLHQGGLWEFPGGKIESDETVGQALARELNEELDITVQKSCPLITVMHQYPDLAVQLHVYTVESYTGDAKGCQGQPVLWVNPDELMQYDFPTANKPIIAAACLPSFYVILDDADSEVSQLLVNLKKILNNGYPLIQGRFKRLSTRELQAFLDEALPLCKEYGAKFLLNSATVAITNDSIDGLHLTSQDLLATKKRPQGYSLVSASCHNLSELRHAEKIGVDFGVLAPLLPTPTHPGVATLGWQRFAELVDQVNIPVYALGGMRLTDLADVKRVGGQGIAGIRAFSQ